MVIWLDNILWWSLCVLIFKVLIVDHERMMMDRDQVSLEEIEFANNYSTQLSVNLAFFFKFCIAQERIMLYQSWCN